MKINKHISIITALSTVFALGIGLIVNANMPRAEADASSYSINSVPTNINLNDASESTIRSYYASLNNLSTSERSGTNLLKNLKPILKNGQKYFSYGGSATKAVWQAYEIVDRDWNKSPASSISGYNAQTNTITGYVYGTGNSDVGTNPYIHALYVNRNVNNQQRAWGNHDQVQWGINQEHIWAKSCGFQDESPAVGARGDLMHLWAANGRVNGNTHSNYYYGYVDTTKTYNDAGSYASTLSGNLRGYSKTLGGSTTVFEPQDSDKGDIARAIFYMAARYNYLSGSDSDGIDAGNPNLEIVNNVTSWSNSGYQSTASTTGKMGILQDLLKWNELDPPDEFEIHRNNLCYNNFTNNRNPFIDFPSWANAIWGTVDANGNYNSTPTTYATPSTDIIGSSTVNPVFGISNTQLNLEVGQTATINATNAGSSIAWTIANGAIASLNKTTTANDENVTVTALSAGTTTITATSGGNSAICQVTVTDNSATYGSLQNPLTISEAIELIDDNNGSLTPSKMYVKGVVSSNTSYNATYENYDAVWLQSESGDDDHAFELYRTKLDSNVNGDYDAANSMAGKEIVAYGFGKRHNTTYELSPNNNNQENPVILSVASVSPQETAADLVEELTTTTKLSYHYDIEEGTEPVTDTLTHASIGVSGTTYTSWDSLAGTSGVIFAGQSAGGDNTSGDAIQLRSKNSNSGIIVTSNTNGLKATSISIGWNSATASGRTIDVYGKDSAYSAPTDLYGNSTVQGTKIGSIVYGTSASLDITGEYEYIGFRSNSGALYLDSISIEWGGSASTCTFSNVSIRFGGLVDQELWDDLDTEETIEGFGVMIATDDVVPNNVFIKDFSDSAALAETDPDITEEIVDYYMATEEMTTPVISGTDYKWNLFHRIDTNNLTTTYVAAAYIKTASGYVFMQQVKYSAKTLAQDYLDNRNCDNTTADGTLSRLANL